MAWSQNEVDDIIKAYFSMLEEELNGVKYSKAEYRRKTISTLNGRSNGSIEFKHQNISAVLAKMGCPYIKGYKPRFNFQILLEEKVGEYLNQNKNKFEKYFEHFTVDSAPFITSVEYEFENILTDAPNRSAHVLKDGPTIYNPIRINYLEKEQNNLKLGDFGEKLIFNYEKWRLMKIGKENLADKIDWVSKTKGDGLGFDILSKNENGTDRFIEVKTTKLSKESPFYVSKREVSFANMNSNNFFLYRVFDWGNNPKIFIKKGDYKSFCFLEPENYKCFI